MKKENTTEENLRTWRQVDPGGQVMTPGNAVNYRSSDWSSQNAVWIEETCIHCLQCWVFCPDNCINVVDEKVVGVDDFYCKGCGICIEVCPTKPKSLVMKTFAIKEK